MVRLNGRFISNTMANNYCGHGFYQFSPELYYRFLCADNGYALESCILWEDLPGTKFYSVPDPDSVRSRINLTSEFGMYMFVQGRRLGDVRRDFIPQQSDYFRLWSVPPNPEDADQRPRGLDALKPQLRRIPGLRIAVMYVRKFFKTEILRPRIKRNTEGFLSPLKGLRVIR